MKTHQVGVRQLRQNLSQYLRRVRAGEHFEVTESNVPVAILAPLPGGGALARLVAEGRVVPARSLLSRLGPPPDLPCQTPISEALAEQRRES
jgi:prevent-host-death family protein